MKTAAVPRLKASLSEYLAGVREGESLIVTDRGRPAAKIIACALRNEEFNVFPEGGGLQRPAGES